MEVFKYYSVAAGVFHSFIPSKLVQMVSACSQFVCLFCWRISGHRRARVQPDVPRSRQLRGDVLRPRLWHVPREPHHQMRMQVPLVLRCPLQGLPRRGGRPHLQSPVVTCISLSRLKIWAKVHKTFKCNRSDQGLDFMTRRNVNRNGIVQQWPPYYKSVKMDKIKKY